MIEPLTIIENAIYDKLNGETFTFNSKAYTIACYKTVPKSAAKPYIHFVGGGFGSDGPKTYNHYNIEHEIQLVADYKALGRAMLSKVVTVWPLRERLSLTGHTHIINELINSSESRDIVNGQERFTITMNFRSLIK